MFKFPRSEERYTPKITDPVFVDIVGDGFYGRYQAKDISLNGLSIFVRNDFKGVDLSKEVEMHLTLPGQKSFKVLGQIRHQGLAATHYFGIQMIFLDSRGKSLVSDYIDSIK